MCHTITSGSTEAQALWLAPFLSGEWLLVAAEIQKQIPRRLNPPRNDKS